jgi:hypothetical protein
MAKLSQGKKQWESPQIEDKQIATPIKGGMEPSKEDIIESANARAQKRHEMKKQPLADMHVLPDSAHMVGDEMVGIKDTGYLVKKNLEYGVNAFYNSLPPGMDIEDQEVCDIRAMDLVVYEHGISYPGDGWTQRQNTRESDMGRDEETNFMGRSGTENTRRGGEG